MSGSYQDGETSAHLKSIDGSIEDIKLAMREHNFSDKQEFAAIKNKIDDVAEATSEAATKIVQQEKINEDRHKENSGHLASLETKIDSALEEIGKVNNKVGKITGIASGAGMVMGFIAGLSGWFWHK